MARVLILATGDPPGTGGARQVSSLLLSSAVSCDTVIVGDSADLPAGVLRAGKVKPLYDAAVIVGTVDRSLESFVYQAIQNAAISVGLPVVVGFGASTDTRGLVSRLLTIAAIGSSPALSSPPLTSPTTATTTAYSTPAATAIRAAATASTGYGPGSPKKASMWDGAPAAEAKGYGGARGGLARPYAFGTAADVRGEHVYGGAKGAAGLSTADAATKALVEDLRDNLIRFGGKGIAHVGRQFAIVDTDGSRVMQLEEFMRGLQRFGLRYSEAQLRTLFSYFDHNGSGSIDYDEFLVGLRGDLNPRRRHMVELAFKQFDRAGRGYVAVDDLIGRYDASKHPDVISGKRKPEEVLREFLDGFDGGQRDGKVTLLEFARYYATISAYIDLDDYFELMIRNCWHISGGEGWCENTTNRRVLVTRRDGTQTVEEVPDDISATNEALIKRALRAKGIDVAAVSMYGGGAGESSIGDSTQSPMTSFASRSRAPASLPSPGYASPPRAAGSLASAGTAVARSPGSLESGTLLPTSDAMFRPGRRLGETRKATISLA